MQAAATSSREHLSRANKGKWRSARYCPEQEKQRAQLKPSEPRNGCGAAREAEQGAEIVVSDESDGGGATAGGATAGGETAGGATNGGETAGGASGGGGGSGGTQRRWKDQYAKTQHHQLKRSVKVLEEKVSAARAGIPVEGA